MPVSGPSPNPHHPPPRPPTIPSSSTPTEMAVAGVFSSSFNQSCPTLSNKQSFPFSNELTEKVNQVIEELQKAKTTPPKVPFWVGIVTFGLYPLVKNFLHQKHIRSLSTQLRELKDQEIRGVLEAKGDQTEGAWIGIGGASQECKGALIEGFLKLPLEEKLERLAGLKTASIILQQTKNTPEFQRWGEVLGDLSQRIENVFQSNESFLEESLMNPTGSGAREIDPETWLQYLEREPVSTLLVNRLVVPGDSNSGLWSGSNSSLYEKTTSKELKKIPTDDLDRALLQVEQGLTIKQYGRGPRLQESDPAHTTDVSSKAKLLLSLVNSNSQAFLQNLKTSLQRNAEGYLQTIGSDESSQTLTILPGKAKVETEGFFTLLSKSGQSYRVRCSYAFEVATTGTKENLEQAIRNVEGEFSINITTLHQPQQISSFEDLVFNDPRIKGEAQVEVMPINVGTDEDLPQIGFLNRAEDMSIQEIAQEAFNTAYQVFQNGGPTTQEGKRTLMRLCQVCASGLRENPDYADQIPDPFDALRAVEKQALTHGLNPISFAEVYEVIKKDRFFFSDELRPFVFGKGASGAPLCAKKRNEWSKLYPIPKQRRMK